MKHKNCGVAGGWYKKRKRSPAGKSLKQALKNMNLNNAAMEQYVG